MKYKAGDIFPQLTVITSKGESLTIPVNGARYTHVQFRRFSGCPICNTHIAALRRGKPELDLLGIHEVLFFHSSNEDVVDFHHDIPFDAVGDPKKTLYRQFGVESLWSALSLSAISAAFSSLLRGKFALKMTGGPLGLPAEFLVGPDGRIKASHYGKDAYDQWPLETIVELATDMSHGASVPANQRHKSTMKSAFHAGAGTLAMLLIVTFLTSTLISEVFLDAAAVLAVKHAIAIYGLACFVVLLAMTGGSGFALSKNRKGSLIEEKKKRMPLIGTNWALIMIPAAIFLYCKAAAGSFDTWFYVVQVLELAVGLVQLTMMGKNFRAGLCLGGRLRQAPIK